jgi:hypothetical protein
VSPLISQPSIYAGVDGCVYKGLTESHDHSAYSQLKSIVSDSKYCPTASQLILYIIKTVNHTSDHPPLSKNATHLFPRPRQHRLRNSNSPTRRPHNRQHNQSPNPLPIRSQHRRNPLRHSNWPYLQIELRERNNHSPYLRSPILPPGKNMFIPFQPR